MFSNALKSTFSISVMPSSPYQIQALAVIQLKRFFGGFGVFDLTIVQRHSWGMFSGVFLDPPENIPPNFGCLN